LSSDLHPQAACDELNGFFTVENLDAAGLVGTSTSQLLFVRQEALDEWNGLESFNGAFKVDGPPGTGKSSIAWAWACFKAQTHSVLWVHVDHTDAGRAALLSNRKVVALPAEVAHLIKLNRASEAQILLVDSMTTALTELQGAALVWREQRGPIPTKSSSSHRPRCPSTTPTSWNTARSLSTSCLHGPRNSIIRRGMQERELRRQCKTAVVAT
jgi:hypothetical protein